MEMLRLRTAAWLVGGAVFLAAASGAIADDNSSTTSRMSTDVSFLAADEQEGRDAGSEGLARSAEYIADRFQELGLEIEFFDGQPFQDFTIPGPPQVGPGDKNLLEFTGAEGNLQLELGSHYMPLALGENGEFSGEIVFAGYGITAPELGYDDYADLDVTGKVVMILRKEPQQNDPASKFDGVQNSQHAFFTSKELNAALHRAAALIIVNDAQTVAAEGKDRLPKTDEAGRAISSSQVPTIFALRSVIDPLLQKAVGKSLQDIEDAIDRDLRPRSQVLTGIQAVGSVQVEESRIPVRNVVGFLAGRGELADEYVIVGAHYDHVGMGGAGSLAPGTFEVHNGADDNASGTVMLMEIARTLASDNSTPRRSLVFIAFTAEEKGLLGSKHYVRNPRWPLEQTVAMINMDMVGRLEANQLTVFGTGTATQFDSMIDRLNQATEFVLDKKAAGFGPSDHASFYEVDIPVLHFFTGLHNDYHRPSDDFEKINLDGMARIEQLIARVVLEVATSPEKPELIRSSAVAQIGRPTQRPPRAALGVVLDAESAAPTIKAFIDDSPSEKAGLKSGDVITSIDGESVRSFDELRTILKAKQPGDEVVLGVDRESEALQLSLILGGQ